MKTLYESILDMDEKNSDIAALRYQVETTTGWTLSSDGKYILSGTKHFPSNIDTYFYGNQDKEWFEKLISCAKKYKLKIQPLGLLTLHMFFIPLSIVCIRFIKIFDNPLRY